MGIISGYWLSRALQVGTKRLRGKVQKLRKAWDFFAVAKNLQQQSEKLAKAAPSSLQRMRGKGIKYALAWESKGVKAWVLACGQQLSVEVVRL